MRLSLTLGLLAALLVLPAGAAAQDETYTLDDLVQRCEDNAPSDELQDACLVIVYLILVPEAGIEPPPDLFSGGTASSGDIPGTGIFVVGTDIAPGTYRTAGPASGSRCYYARLSGFSGTLDDIISNDNAGGPAIVTISRSDVAFETSRCQPWTELE